MFNRRSDPQDAADFVQEAFARYADATLEWEAKPDCPESYLTQVAVNVMHERGRNSAHRATLSIEDVALVGPDQEAALEARDMLNRVDEIMMTLKPLTRDIFIARRYHQLRRAEIAAQTGLSLRAEDKQLARGWQHLLRHLGELDEA
jgi:RNA polymerase sigma-70 factor (ECF subfamily)